MTTISAVATSPAPHEDQPMRETGEPDHSVLDVGRIVAQVREVPLALIDPSPFQRRTVFDESQLRDLARSIKSEGLLQPITVRPLPSGRYELIAGERRVRAFQCLDRRTIPAIIRPCTDDQARTLLAIENLQRADLLPLEEAEQFALLLSQPEPVITVAELAVRIGKHPGYVRSRVQLTHLVEEAKQALREHALSLRVALHVARLPEADQRDVLPVATQPDHLGRRPSEATIAREIERRYHQQLARAPFDPADATLVPARGACTTCPRRTGFDPTLFPDIAEEDTCTDRTCFHAKREAHVERVLVVQIERAAKKGRAVVRLSEQYGHLSVEDGKPAPLSHSEYTVVKPNEKCEHTVTGVLVDGSAAGTVLRVCPDATCRTHRAAGVGGRAPTAGNDYAARKRERRKAVQRERVALRRVLDATIAALPLTQGPTLAIEELRLVAMAMMERLWSETAKQIARARKLTPEDNRWGYPDHPTALRSHIATLATPDLLHLLVEMALAAEAWPSVNSTDEPTRLLALAQRVGVDAEAIRRGGAPHAPASAAPASTVPRTRAPSRRGKRAKRARRKEAA